MFDCSAKSLLQLQPLASMVAVVVAQHTTGFGRTTKDLAKHAHRYCRVLKCSTDVAILGRMRPVDC